MKTENFLNPPTCVLPFEMFRTFSPISNGDSVLSTSVSPCEINETENECVLAINLPVRVDPARVTAEFKGGMLRVMVAKI
jgi:HSP20 family molecular chaperone IbpA